MMSAIMAQVLFREVEQSCGRLRTAFLEVNKRACQLDQAFVERTIGGLSLGKP